MENLDIKEFNILVELEQNGEKASETEKVSEKTGLSVELVESTVEKLKKAGYIMYGENGCQVTEEGYRYLEPYKVKRAVLMAAGFGSRMKPVTLTTPKPMVKVNGKVIIETLLDALVEKGITDITIVTGYLNEKFEELKKKYPMVRTVYNDRYSCENNISSAMHVKDLYSNAYVMDADLYLRNKDIVRRYEYASNYIGVWVDETDDWRFIMEDDHAVGMTRGGKDVYLMAGISYWTKDAGEHFEKDIQELYQTEEGKQCYWDDVVLTKFNEHYDIKVRPCTADDITEIDSIEELAQVDPSYKKYTVRA